MQSQSYIAECLHAPVPAPKLVTEVDIAHLPATVQRYLAFVGAVGSGDAAWELDGKDFTYARFELLDVEYNVA